VSDLGLPVSDRVAPDAPFRPSPEEIKQPDRPKFRDVLGPGLITGASDDDPSGIATYSQAGAQFGYSLGWTLLLTYPLMCAIQMISAQIGRVTGRGLAGNMRRHYPAPLLHALVGLLVVANTINIGADLGAMAAALRLLVSGPTVLYVAGFAVATVLLVFAVGVPWGTVAHDLVLPHLEFSGSYLTVVVAVFGTTISPYLFFWQAGEEVEDEKENPAAEPLVKAPQQAPRELARIQIDTLVGIGFSNVIALFIMLTTAATLNAHGVKDIQTSSQAAEALRPIAGDFVAGSAAYAVGEALQRRVGLTQRPGRAKAFYCVIAAATLVGAVLNFTPLDPIKALFWSAVINGVAAVPIMVMIMLLGSRQKVMRQFTLGPWLKSLGWLATAVMAAAAVGMFAKWGD
jgi:Mn2+/Fe2+ NRAMP family transporter